MKVGAVVAIFALLLCLFPQASFAADKKDKNKKKAWVAGKVYDIDKTSPLDDVPIRIVKVEDGKSMDEKTEEEGCYWFEDVDAGTYALSVNYGGKDYLLPDKFLVENLREREVAVSVCVAVSDKDQSLTLLKDCHICLGGGFPPLGITILSAAGVLVPGIIIGAGEDPIVSESRPSDGSR